MPGCSEACSDRKSTRLNSSHMSISYAVFCLKKKNIHFTAIKMNKNRDKLLVLHVVVTTTSRDKVVEFLKSMQKSPHLPILFFFFNDTATTEIYTLSLHDALPIWSRVAQQVDLAVLLDFGFAQPFERSEEHTSELQSHVNLVCRLLLEKKKNIMGNPMFVDMMNALGGNGVAMGYDQVFSALQTGVIDFFFNDPPTTEIYTLSLHDALPISGADAADADDLAGHPGQGESLCQLAPVGRQRPRVPGEEATEEPVDSVDVKVPGQLFDRDDQRRVADDPAPAVLNGR